MLLTIRKIGVGEDWRTYIKNAVIVREETRCTKYFFFTQSSSSTGCITIKQHREHRKTITPSSRYAQRTNTEIKVNICGSKPQKYRVQNVKGPCTAEANGVRRHRKEQAWEQEEG